MLLELLIFIVSFVVLIFSSDKFVQVAARIAEKLGISEFLIGLTLVALGTSVPELAASIVAAINGNTELIVGNIIGSNIANIGLVIGFAALLMSLKTHEQMLIRDGYVMITASVLFYILMFYRMIPWPAGLLLIVLYFAYVIFLFETQKKTRDEYHFKAFIPYFFRFGYIRTIHKHILSELKRERKKPAKEFKTLIEAGFFKDLFMIIISVAGIYFSAKVLVAKALFFAQYFHVSETVIGVTLVAFGTSVPELSVSISAARKGFGNLAVGNIIGSNIANILLVGGVSAMIKPLVITNMSLFLTGPAMLIMSLLLLVFIKSQWRIHKFEGFVILVLYSVFILLLLVTNAIL